MMLTTAFFMCDSIPFSIEMRYRAMAMTNVLVGTMDDGIVDVGFGSTGRFGKG